MLSREHKKEILDYVLPEGSSWKSILEDTSVGEDYGEGGVTSEDISRFIDEVRQREEKYQGLTQRHLLLNFNQPIYFEMPDGRTAHIQSMKIIENGQGYGEHLVYAVLPLLGDMTIVEPPIPTKVWLGVNMRSIQEVW